MKGMHYNFKDIFRAARIGFSLQRIWINGLGLLASYIVYLVLTYVALLVGGHSLGSIWFKFGLLPCVFASGISWYAWIIYVIGVIISLAVILMTNTAVSRTVYMVLREELFYTWTQAFKFALKKWISVLGAMVTFIFMIAFFVVAAIIMGLIGQIPYVGELGTTFLTIPYVLSAVLLFFIIIVFGVAGFFVPAIIATSDEDALGGVFQSFSISFNQPWRIVVYGTMVIVLEAVGIFLFAAALKISYWIFIWLFSLGMGEKILVIQSYALYIIDQAIPAVYGWIHSILGDVGNWVYLIHHHAAPPSVPATYAISSYMLAIFLIFIGGSVLAYGEAIGNAGLTLIYIILYQKQEKESLLEREDEELKEEEEEEGESETNAGTEEKSGEDDESMSPNEEEDSNNEEEDGEKE